MAFIRNASLAIAVALAGTPIAPAHAAMNGENGKFYFRYKTERTFSEVTPPNESKDITAFFVGGVGYEFLEKLPLKPEWQDDDWRIVSGRLPSGLTFNHATREFVGTPTEEAQQRVVELAGYDQDDNEIANARVTFDVFTIAGTAVKEDFYARTGKYKLIELAIPNGVTIDNWQRVYLPPDGISVNGPYFEGTPRKASSYRYFIRGQNYMGETVATFFGNYLVEDGPSFPMVADYVRDLPRSVDPFVDFRLQPPRINHALDGFDKVRYFFEIAEQNNLPGTVVSNDQPKALSLMGRVARPYETAKIRWKAIDVDGTPGVSEWLTFGTGNPTPTCAVADEDAYNLSFPTGTEVNAQLAGVSGGIGLKSYNIVSGELPEGLALDGVRGAIVGTPVKMEAARIVSVRIDVTNNQNVVSETCSYRVSTTNAPLSLSDLTAEQDRYVRVGDVFTGAVGVKGGIPHWSVTLLEPEAWPTFSITSPAADQQTVSFRGTVVMPGTLQVPFGVVNGDGNSSDRRVNIYGRGPIAMPTVPTVRIKRLADSQTWSVIPFDQATVIPEVSKPGKYPSFAIGNGPALPVGIRLEAGRIVGETSVPAGTYGPFAVEMSDYSGDRVQSNDFNIVVEPRDEMKGHDPVEPLFTADLDRVQTTPKRVFDVVQPPGAKNFTVTWALNGNAPAWLQFDPATGNMTALAGIPRSYIGSLGPFTITATDAEGSAVTSNEFNINVRDLPAPGGMHVPQFRATAEGDVSRNEYAPKVNIQNLVSYVDPNSVIGGTTSVTFVSAEPLPNGLVFDPVAGSLSGVVTEEFNGNIRVTIKDARDRTGYFDVPLEVRGYPRVGLDATSYELPRLAEASTLSLPIAGRKISGFWNEPIWTWADGVIAPAGLSVDPATGTIKGATTLPVNAVIPDLRLKATSRSAVGTNLVSVTDAFSIKVTAPASMTLSYSSQASTYFLRDQGNGRYALASKLASNPVPGGSFVRPLKYVLEQDEARMNGLEGLDIDPATGTLLGVPTTLGKWSVEVTVSDAEGRKPSSAVPIEIKSTLAGNVERSNGGGSFFLRDGEPFKTDALSVSNAVGSVVFLTEPAVLPATIDFAAATGAFSDESYISSAGYRPSVYVNAKDEDGRTFKEPARYDFTAVHPLAIVSMPAEQRAIASKQYSAEGDDPINVTFTPDLRNQMGKIGYSLDGELPGTAVTKAHDPEGNLLGWFWKDQQGINQSLPATTLESDLNGLLPLDALVFDSKALTLRGIPSKAGTFGGIKLVASDDHQMKYIKNVPSRVKNNTAASPEIVITVAPAEPLMAVNMIGSVEANSQELSQFTGLASLRTEVRNLAYGRPPVEWKMLSGTLPEKVTVSGETTRHFSGYPENTGVFDNIVQSVKDAAGRQVNTSPVTFTVGTRKALELATAYNPVGLVVNTTEANVVITAINSAFGRVIPQGDWTVTGIENLPPGITHEVSNGKVSFTGKAEVIGTYRDIVVSAVDSLGSRASINLTFNVILPTDAIVLDVSNIRTKVGYDFEMQATATNTYGTVRFYSQDIVGNLASQLKINGSTGLVSGRFSSVQDLDFDVYVSDSTNRITSKPVLVSVLPNLRVTVPQIVETAQSERLERAIAADYVIGATTFAKGSGDWPVGIEVDPNTGTIFANDTSYGAAVNNVIAEARDYPGLTIVGTDTFGAGFTDTKTSNVFTIRVEPIKATPVIANIAGNRLDFGVVGTASSPFTPTVTDSVKSKPWNYAGTVYSLNRALPAGLNFDTQTGTISGTPNEAVIIRDLKIRVTSQNGDFSETAPFWFGVAPKDAITPTAGQKTVYTLRVGEAYATETPRFDNTMGTLSYRLTVAAGPNLFNTATGVLSKAVISADQVGSLPMPIEVSDEFGRKGLIGVRLDILNAIGLTLDPKMAFDLQFAYTDAFVPTITNIYGTPSFTVTGLPNGLTFNGNTGAISGTLSSEYVGGEAFNVVYTVTDSRDGKTASKAVALTAKAANSHRYWRVIRGNNSYSQQVYEIVLLDKIGTDLTARIRNGTATYTSGGMSSPQLLVDGNMGTSGYFNAYGTPYIDIDFGTGVEVKQLRLTTPAGFYISPQYSDDRVNWTDAPYTRTISGQLHTYTLN